MANQHAAPLMDGRHPDHPALNLRAVGRCVTAATDGLSDATRAGCLRQAEAWLEKADRLLAGLVADPDLDGTMAQRLESIRDDLAGHLLAASALESLDMPVSRVADVLRRGVSSARSGLHELAAG